MWLSSEMKWKLADLETSRWTGKRSLPASSLEYSAPEVVRSTRKQIPLTPRPSADMWSVGIIAHELLTGKGEEGGLRGRRRLSSAQVRRSSDRSLPPSV